MKNLPTTISTAFTASARPPRASRLAAAVVGLTAVVGCNNIESGDLETSGMNASMTISPRADGSATDVSVTLTAGALTFVDLDGEDQLIASSGEASVVLAESDVLSIVAYRGTLDGVGTPGDEVTVALERSADKTPAPDSHVRLPVPVAISAPAASTEFSRADDDIVVEITSDASEDDVTLRWSGECIKAGSIDVPADQASATIARGTIEKREQVDENDPDSEPVPDTCTFSITVERKVQGTLDAAYGSGGIEAVSSDSRSYSTKP